MKEFVEKLIGRLEEDYKPDIECFESKDDYEVSITRYNRLLNIVNQLAEEYNNGWIPVEQKLPEENGKYIAYYHKWSDGNYLPKFDETEIRILRYRNNDWIFPTYGNTEAEKDSHREVIAWQPLPAPFKKGSE